MTRDRGSGTISGLWAVTDQLAGRTGNYDRTSWTHVAPDRESGTGVQRYVAHWPRPERRAPNIAPSRLCRNRCGTKTSIVASARTRTITYSVGRPLGSKSFITNSAILPGNECVRADMVVSRLSWFVISQNSLSSPHEGNGVRSPTIGGTVRAGGGSFSRARAASSRAIGHRAGSATTPATHRAASRRLLVAVDFHFPSGFRPDVPVPRPRQEVERRPRPYVSSFPGVDPGLCARAGHPASHVVGRKSRQGECRRARPLKAAAVTPPNTSIFSSRWTVIGGSACPFMIEPRDVRLAPQRPEVRCQSEPASRVMTRRPFSALHVPRIAPEHPLQLLGRHRPQSASARFAYALGSSNRGPSSV